MITVVPTITVCAVCGGPENSFHKNHEYRPDTRGLAVDRRRVPFGGRRAEDRENTKKRQQNMGI